MQQSVNVKLSLLQWGGVRRTLSRSTGDVSWLYKLALHKSAPNYRKNAIYYAWGGVENYRKQKQVFVFERVERSKRLIEKRPSHR